VQVADSANQPTKRVITAPVINQFPVINLQSRLSPARNRKTNTEASSPHPTSASDGALHGVDRHIIKDPERITRN
jgi:hypothetical protein